MAICTMANFFKILAIMNLQIMAKKKTYALTTLSGTDTKKIRYKKRRWASPDYMSGTDTQIKKERRAKSTQSPPESTGNYYCEHR